MKILLVTTCCILAIGSFIFGTCMAWNGKPSWGVFIFTGFVFVAAAGAACEIKIK